MYTIATALSQHTRLIESDSARLDCELLLCNVLNKDRAFLYTWPEKELSEDQFQGFNSLFKRRLKGEPVAHILGEKEFWSISLLVNNSTLIPRPETELLVEQVLALYKEPRDMNSLDQDLSLVDLGTGTGAIALAIAAEKPTWHLTALEKNPIALDLAKDNQQRLALSNVTFLLSDWFEVVKGQRFDVIVSNPPYIDETDHHLRQGDVRFEPLSALVADQNGLADLFYLIEKAPAYLKNQGWILLEHGNQQGFQVREVLKAQGFVNIKTKKDLAGHERVTLAQYQSK